MKYNVYSQEAPVVVESIPRNGNPNVRIVAWGANLRLVGTIDAASGEHAIDTVKHTVPHPVVHALDESGNERKPTWPANNF